jgi:hypothetical protein
MKRRGLVAVFAVMGTLVLVGCYGQTKPATHLAPNGAWLEADGTADNGPAYTYFEFWKTSEPSHKTQTVTRNWPATASHAFHEEVPLTLSSDLTLSRGLTYGTSYSYRLCGGDQGQPAKCAQTQSFTTPVGDSVDGYFAFGYRNSDPKWFFNAWSGAAGQSPDGKVIQSDLFNTFDGHVTCLAVNGNRAAIGATGTQTDYQGTSQEKSYLVTVEVPNSAGVQTLGVQDNGTAAPDCAHPSFANQGTSSFVANLRLQDAPG